jgi:hypothetical protein
MRTFRAQETALPKLVPFRVEIASCPLFPAPFFSLKAVMLRNVSQVSKSLAYCTESAPEPLTKSHRGNLGATRRLNKGVRGRMQVANRRFSAVNRQRSDFNAGQEGGFKVGLIGSAVLRHCKNRLELFAFQVM